MTTACGIATLAKGVRVPTPVVHAEQDPTRQVRSTAERCMVLKALVEGPRLIDGNPRDQHELHFQKEASYPTLLHRGHVSRLPARSVVYQSACMLV